MAESLRSEVAARKRERSTWVAVSVTLHPASTNNVQSDTLYYLLSRQVTHLMV